MTPVEYLLERILKFISFRPRSEYEIKRWLARKKVSEEDGEIALKQLKASGLINDEVFCQWWVEQRNTFRPKSRRALVFELVKKGVDRELAKSVVGGSPLNDEDLARLVLQKRQKSLDRYDPEARRQKITNLLASRGFGWEIIRKLTQES